jgi:uncharacterized protein (TIGR02145 family)
MFVSCDGKSKKVSSVIVTPNSTTRAVGCILPLNATVLPESAVGKNVDWSSSNPDIASVENGIVTTHAPGESVITATVQGTDKKAVCNLTVAHGCNNDTPGWGKTLGRIGFKTDRIWKISNQEWSDAVVASNCKKTTFRGGQVGNQNADCRSNESGHGDLFSWCAVIRFQEFLCPDGWRVPNGKDFAALDIALKNSGDGQSSYTDTVTSHKYLSVWGGTYGGYCGVDGLLGGQDWSAYYWTQDERGADRGYRLNFHSDGYIFPQGWISKDNGFALRCVR